MPAIHLPDLPNIATDEWSIFNALLETRDHDGRYTNVLVDGPPGTGKTTAALTQGLNGRDALRIQALPGATHYDVFGQTGLRDGSTHFDKGAPALGIERGYRIVIDESDNASEDLRTALFALMDGHPFTLPDGTTIFPHDDAQFVLTTNQTERELVFPEGILDRVAFARILTPAPAILERLPEDMRETCKRCVAHNITGTRAWLRFASLLETMPDYSMSTLSRVAFGERGPDIVDAWKITSAQTCEPTTAATVKASARVDRYDEDEDDENAVCDCEDCTRYRCVDDLNEQGLDIADCAGIYDKDCHSKADGCHGGICSTHARCHECGRNY